MIDAILAASSAESLPASVSAVGALIAIVWWLVKRADSADARRDNELERVRGELDEVRKQHAIALAERDARIEIGRDEVHELINRLTPMHGALSFVAGAIDRCTCGALSPEIRAYIQDIRQKGSN